MSFSMSGGEGAVHLGLALQFSMLYIYVGKLKKAGNMDKRRSGQIQWLKHRLNADGKRFARRIAASWETEVWVGRPFLQSLGLLGIRSVTIVMIVGFVLFLVPAIAAASLALDFFSALVMLKGLIAVFRRYGFGGLSGGRRFNLHHLLLLVLTLDQADERLGDLNEEYARISRRMGRRYAGLWYVWSGFWVIAAAFAARIPGKLLVDAIRSRITKE